MLPIFSGSASLALSISWFPSPATSKLGRSSGAPSWSPSCLCTWKIFSLFKDIRSPRRSSSCREQLPPFPPPSFGGSRSTMAAPPAVGLLLHPQPGWSRRIGPSPSHVHGEPSSPRLRPRPGQFATVTQPHPPRLALLPFWTQPRLATPLRGSEAQALFPGLQTIGCSTLPPAWSGSPSYG